MTFSSWTYDQKGIDYFPYSDTIGTSNYLDNEAWRLMKTIIRRHEVPVFSTLCLYISILVIFYAYICFY